MERGKNNFFGWTYSFIYITMSTGKVLLGVLAGVAAGALIGILFAPDKGSVTRKKISKKGEDYAETLKEKFDEFLDSISEKFNEVKEEVSDLTEQKKSKSQKTKNDAEPAAG
jgi:gas vesicle protein